MSDYVADDYVETTRGVAERYKAAGGDMDVFDRWLTEHDRQVANRAWMRCEAAIAGHLAGKSTITEAIATLWPRNPYRKEQGNE